MEDIEKEIAGEELLEDQEIIKNESLENQETVTEGNDNIIEQINNDDDDDFFDDKKKKKRKEDDIIRFSKRGIDSDKKRNIIIIILIVIAIILIGVIGFLILTKKDNKSSNEDDNNTQEVVKEDEKEETGKKVFYVSCDDNTAPLNVRNSISGDIIDGLTCFKEVEILEEAGSTDACDKWYKINYQKKGSSYTGYACGKYIKESISDSTSMKKMKEVIDKANKYYEDNQVMVYCGETTGTKTIQIEEDSHTFDGQYLKSEFKSIDELKKHILTFIDESLIKVKLEVADYNNPKMYDNYYEIDGNLYCRDYSGKGILKFYTGNYDIEVVSETDNNVNLKIVYEYIDENKLDEDDSKCSLANKASCPSSYLKYVIKNITLSKDNGNYIVTKMEFHD